MRGVVDFTVCEDLLTFTVSALHVAAPSSVISMCEGPDPSW